MLNTFNCVKCWKTAMSVFLYALQALKILHLELTLWACLPTTPRYLAMCSVWDDGFSVPRVYYTACTCETMIYWGERKWVELRFYIYIYYLAYIIPYISDALIAASRMRNISKIFVRTTWFLWKPAWMMTIMKDSQEGQLERVHLCMKKVIVVFQWWHSG